MRDVEKRRRVRFSSMYSSCLLPSPSLHSDTAVDGTGNRGYSREAYCNDPVCEEAVEHGYQGNYVSTTKYTVANFFPKSLFEQFRRVANMFFLVGSVVSFSPLAPFKAVSVLLPLLVVVGTTMAKEAVEDWRRRQQVITTFWWCFLDAFMCVHWSLSILWLVKLFFISVWINNIFNYYNLCW